MVSLSAVVAVAALVLPRTPSLATAVSPRSSKSVASIAVLPLTNLSGSEANESLADGITEEVTTALAKIDRRRSVAVLAVLPAAHDAGTLSASEILGDAADDIDKAILTLPRGVLTRDRNDRRGCLRPSDAGSCYEQCIRGVGAVV